jgi:hypothetical protein
MAEEFTIKSQQIEDKINQLLPSQGGFQPGVDFSASTMVIPIVDLTETAEGSSLRQDLQTAFSHTASDINTNTSGTDDLVTTTGYYRVLYSYFSEGTPGEASIFINDGATSKAIVKLKSSLSGSSYYIVPVTGEVIVLLQAGDTLRSNVSGSSTLVTTTRQIADLQGNLVNP